MNARVFLSFHSPDRAIALGLKNAIEFALPGTDVFVDETHLRHGHLWQPSLFDAIANSQAFLILISTRVGDWQKLEYYQALDRKARDNTFVLLPVIIADRAKGPSANLPGLPLFHWVESTEPNAPEPLAKIVAALQSPEAAKPPEPWRAINPYRGLVALEEQDADFFFARDGETAGIIQRIIAAPGRLIALVGNSGVGKSSLVQAGVIGSLKRQRWPGQQRKWPQVLKDSRSWVYLNMKPGADPIDALMSAFVRLWFPDPTDPSRIDRRRTWAERLHKGTAQLRDVVKATDDHFRDNLSLTPPPRIFIYIDQGEELYARTSLTARKRFSQLIVDGLSDNPQRLVVMTSQRADYYGKLQANIALFRLTEKIDVPPLDSDNLALLLREPARVLGVRFESDRLVGQLVKSVEDQPGALPLLADFFTDLWDHMQKRGDGTIRVLDHGEIVQVGAALSRRADEFLAQSPEKVEVAKRLFTLRLAHVPRQGEPVRARWELNGEPNKDPTVAAEWALAEQLAGSEWRLLVTGEKDGKATAELAHEVLLKAWPTLEHWLENQRAFLVWRGELGTRREEYENAGKEGARAQRQALLMGLPLDTAKKWLATRRRDIESGDRVFIENSVRAEQAGARNRAWLLRSVGVLMVCIIGGLIGWINEPAIREQWHRLTVEQAFAAEKMKPLSDDDERILKPGERFRECIEEKDRDHCPKMIVIPANIPFTMGSPKGENLISDKLDNEGPQHLVTITKPFAVAETELTFDEWDTCVAYGDCRQGVDQADWGRGQQPVIFVTWDDAQRYVKWLSRITSKPYRLLTEAQFEYATRARTQTKYPWGDDPDKQHPHANCNGCGGRWENTLTAPVHSFEPNGFGLYNMVGNVYEWVEDCYHPNYNDNPPLDGSEWTTSCPDKNVRTARNGSWVDDPDRVRSAVRKGFRKEVYFYWLGFRVARMLPALN